MPFISARIQIGSYLDSRGDKTQISIHSFGDANFSHSLFDVIFPPRIQIGSYLDSRGVKNANLNSFVW